DYYCSSYVDSNTFVLF
nr:immunoglobulin light chain junction region [Macaca mulatta]MOV97244.1 immunoglobulin light chain junction region [Macaca mulatta]MOW00085.1 immunoglobulin light chain junction region [Macaca mulatta]